MCSSHWRENGGLSAGAHARSRGHWQDQIAAFKCCCESERCNQSMWHSSPEPHRSSSLSDMIVLHVAADICRVFNLEVTLSVYRVIGRDHASCEMVNSERFTATCRGELLLKPWRSCAGAPCSHPLYVNVCKTLTISGLSGHGSVKFTVFAKPGPQPNSPGERERAT